MVIGEGTGVDRTSGVESRDCQLDLKSKGSKTKVTHNQIQEKYFFLPTGNLSYSNCFKGSIKQQISRLREQGVFPNTDGEWR